MSQTQVDVRTKRPGGPTARPARDQPGPALDPLCCVRAVLLGTSDTGQSNYIYFNFPRFVLQVFGQSWAQERAQRSRLEESCINQRKLARRILKQFGHNTGPALDPLFCVKAVRRGTVVAVSKG